MRKSCLTFALDKMRKEGGYLLVRKSVHWEIAHVMHLGWDRETLRHFAPPNELAKPSRALFGFEGEVLEDDQDPPERMTLSGIVSSAIVALVVIVCWAIRVKLTGDRHDARDPGTAG